MKKDAKVYGYLSNLSKESLIDLYLQKAFDYGVELSERHKKIVFLKTQLKIRNNELEITKRALNLAVEDKCKIENELLTEQFGAEAKLMTPQKEQWYLERAKEIIESESNND